MGEICFQREGGRQFVLEIVNAFDSRIIKPKPQLQVVLRRAGDMQPQHQRGPGLLDVQSRNVMVLSFVFLYLLSSIRIKQRAEIQHRGVRWRIQQTSKHCRVNYRPGITLN